MFMQVKYLKVLLINYVIGSLKVANYQTNVCVYMKSLFRLCTCKWKLPSNSILVLKNETNNE